MYCHGCQAPIGDLCAALGLTVGDLFDGPPSAGHTLRVVQRPPVKPRYTDLDGPGRILWGLGMQRLCEDIEFATTVKHGPPPDLDLMDLIRWGPGGRAHFADPRPGDFMGTGHIANDYPDCKFGRPLTPIRPKLKLIRGGVAGGTRSRTTAGHRTSRPASA